MDIPVTAFPYRFKTESTQYVGTGMSLRQYFAAKAMHIAATGIYPDAEGIPRIAVRAVEIADAVIAECNKATPP